MTERGLSWNAILVPWPLSVDSQDSYDSRGRVGVGMASLCVYSIFFCCFFFFIGLSAGGCFVEDGNT